MQKVMTFLGLSVLLASTNVWAGDVTVKGQGSDVTVSGEPTGNVTIQQNPNAAADAAATAAAASASASAAAQNIQWTVLQGEIKSLDHQAQKIALKLKGSDSVVTLSSDPKLVAIYKNGDHRYSANDVKNGDNVTLRRLQ